MENVYYLFPKKSINQYLLNLKLGKLKKSYDFSLVSRSVICFWEISQPGSKRKDTMQRLSWEKNGPLLSHSSMEEGNLVCFVLYL